MPVFRVEKTKDFTVMSNHHLRNREISLKAKGLLSQILSLPPDWDYTLAGLAAINLEGVDAIREAVKELEAAGYITREQRRTDKGQFSGNEYVIRELPMLENPTADNPRTEKPMMEHPSTGPPVSENPRELRNEVINTEKQNTDCINHSFHSFPDEAEKKRRERDAYRELIHENISYEFLSRDISRKEEIDEIVEIMLDVICSSKTMIRINGDEVPKEVVKSRFLKINSEHIQFVLDCMHQNTTSVRSIRQYLLTVLYNAPVTISNYYTALVNHDLYGGD